MTIPKEHSTHQRFWFYPLIFLYSFVKCKENYEFSFLDRHKFNISKIDIHNLCNVLEFYLPLPSTIHYIKYRLELIELEAIIQVLSFKFLWKSRSKSQFIHRIFQKSIQCQKLMIKNPSQKPLKVSSADKVTYLEIFILFSKKALVSLNILDILL